MAPTLPVTPTLPRHRSSRRLYRPWRSDRHAEVHHPRELGTLIPLAESNPTAQNDSAEAREAWTVPVMSPAQRRSFKALVGVWVLALAWFWSWWFQADHVASLGGMIVSSALIGWTTLLPGWFFFFVLRMRRTNSRLALPLGRIAMVVTKAPSEPWPLVRKTLEAMLQQQLEGGRRFDVWLADEDPSPETRDWCARHHVRMSCRKGVEGYNNAAWPGRRKCKEGNLRYFYEVAGGYADYDFVVQLDADHVPSAGYLASMIRPFANPRVGYVAAPSICDANASSSWAARARLHAEATLHGPLQAGYYDGGFAPLCIGSHYAVRTRALQESGGLGPELAEDHSTTLTLVAHGWTGAFALDAIAHGDGPASLADCMTQEYQWSRSLMRLLLSFTPRVWGRLSLKARIEFGFAQVWYPVFALHMLVASLIPPIALLTGRPWVQVSFVEFIAHGWMLTAACVAPVIWLRRQGWCRPDDAKVLSWESGLFQLTRWPWVLMGVTDAIIGHVFHKEFEFRVTPKASTGATPLGVPLVLPYAAIVALQAGALILIGDAGRASGYYWLGLTTTLIYVVALAAAVALHLREIRAASSGKLRAFARTCRDVAPLLFASTMLFGIAASVRGPVAFAAAMSLQPASAALVAEGATGQVVVEHTVTKLERVESALPVPVVADAVDRLAAASKPRRPEVVAGLDLPHDGLALGAYDPERQLPSEVLGLEQWFVRQDDPAELVAALQHAQNRHSVMVTIEPYPASGDTAPVLDRVNQGDSDVDIHLLAQVVARNAPQVVLVRWGHEMELSGLYPWAANDPALYRAAFRRVVSIFRSEGAHNARFVWSPAGGENARAFYPGDDVVDYVGVTVLGDAQWDSAEGKPAQSFAELFGPKYARVSGLGKPVIVAEMGVSGSAERKQSWLRQALASAPQYPNLRAMVYFNAPNPWPGTLNLKPDWRISAQLLARAESGTDGAAEGSE